MNGSEKSVDFGFTEELFPPGVHMCYIYNNEKERRETMGKYINAGLGAGEKAIYLVDKPAGEIDEYISQMGIDLEAAKTGRLELHEAVKGYCPSGTFEPEAVLDFLTSAYYKAIEDGYSGIRATGEADWVHRGNPGSERWIEYEARINYIMPKIPYHGAICQYDANLLSATMLITVLNVHPMMIIRGQVVRNPYYMPPDEFLRDYMNSA